MKYDTARPYLAVFLIFRKDDKIAFLLRENAGWMNGYYGIISGKVEHNESATQGAIREAHEEVGATIKTKDLRPVLSVYRKAEDDTLAWFDLVFEVTAWQGELQNAEPDVHSELVWLDPHNLPENTVPVHRFILEQVEAGNTYAEHNWDN